jgi:hypothetical protein
MAIPSHTALYDREWMGGTVLDPIPSSAQTQSSSTAAVVKPAIDEAVQSTIDSIVRETIRGVVVDSVNTAIKDAITLCTRPANQAIRDGIREKVRRRVARN